MLERFYNPFYNVMILVVLILRSYSLFYHFINIRLHVYIGISAKLQIDLAHWLSYGRRQTDNIGLQSKQGC